MAQKVTIRDIAEKTGTSVTSVHRAIYGGKGISQKLREKILFEVERSNYQMDEAASMLRRRQFRITVLLPEAAGQERFYFRGLWDGIYKGTRELQKNKVEVTFVETKHGVSRMAEDLERLYDETDESLNGLVTVCDDAESSSWLQRFMKRGTRVALIDRGVEIENLCCCMEVSSRDMGNLAVHMMRFLTGREKEGMLVLINGPETRFSYRVYADTVEKRVREQLPNLEMTVLDGYDIERGPEELERLLGKGNVRGVIASCARGTYWACETLQRLQMADPPHLVGADVFEELTPFFENGILEATVYQSHREHGEKALRILYDSLVNPYAAAERTGVPAIPVGLILRENYKYYL
ncbi:MAG: substrate-binding domain-containing protein [Candidatus Limivivens sp.]|nr:substrate-binding domain-containing protein [Candidatus Limivivens sp.]